LQSTAVLDLALYDRIRLRLRPPVQRAIAEGFLRWDYRKVDLRIEGLDRIPSEPVIFAMNHTDNFNYWPFQYLLHRDLGRYTATWVKGKNYEGMVSRTFMRWTNNIPLASRGYVITRDFVNTMGRRPTPEEYRALRRAVDALEPVDPAAVPAAILERPRDMLGRPFGPQSEGYAEAVDALMGQLMDRFVAMNREALAMGLHILVFPQGTRSRRLSRGHIGLAQVALHLGATIVPVGCSGSDEVYTSRSVLAKPGAITYRVGKPLPTSTWSGIAPEGARPFARDDEAAHRDAYQAVVDRVMEAIDGLVDEPYRFSSDQTSDGTAGADRFL
jgi:1-acyl-sn-glycerol-3-phosphate acyltransferase